MRKILVSIAILLLSAWMLAAAAGESARTVTLFYTGDEHGYLEAASGKSKSYGGAASLMGMLRRHGYTPDSDRALLLSGGDMWAGPAISSSCEGISVVQVANAMGYDAAAIGNHEFDFGQARLRSNARAASFPFISANVIEIRSGKAPDYVRPYIIKDVGGVKTAVIGLAGIFTPSIVLPSNVEGLEFLGYEETLRKTVPAVRAKGAELVVVVAHACPEDLKRLAPVAAELSIPLLAGGHCHSEENSIQDGVRIISAGSHMRMFARVDIALDAFAGKVLKTEAEFVPVESSRKAGAVVADPAVEAIVSEWAAKIEKELGGVIGYSRTGIDVGWPMYNLLVDSWLWAYPEADIAISNFGGYRDRIPAGDIKESDIVATWPFDNRLVEVRLTGKQVLDNLECCGGTVAGLTYKKSGRRATATLKDGRPLDPGAMYRVLVNSYIYEGGERYLFSKQNPGGRIIAVNWRDPVIRWIVSQRTDSRRPLETLLDGDRRGPERR